MKNEDRHPFSKGAGLFVQLPETLLLSSSGENSSSCSSASFSGESDDGEVLGDNSAITPTPQTHQKLQLLEQAISHAHDWRY